MQRRLSDGNRSRRFIADRIGRAAARCRRISRSSFASLTPLGLVSTLLIAFMIGSVPIRSAAEARVYHSEPDTGAPSTTAITLEPGTTRVLRLWLETTGPASSVPEARCESGDGAELCALLLDLEATGTVSFASFVPDPGVDVVSSLSPARFRLNLLDPVDPVVGRQRLGTLEVAALAASCSGGCRVDVAQSRMAGAALQLGPTALATESPTLLTVPEPRSTVPLALGALALAGRVVGRRRRARRGAPTRPLGRSGAHAGRVSRRGLCAVLLAIVSILGIGGLLLSASSSSAQIAYRHEGAVDPALQGWGITPGDNGADQVDIGPVAPDPDYGGEAWSVADIGTISGSRLRYEVPLTAIEVADADVRGWTLRLVLRVIEPPGAATDALDASIVAEVSEGPGDRRYGLIFGTDPAVDGDPVVGVLGGAAAVSSGPSEYTLEGVGDGYHEYALSVDPATGQASVWVDGIRRISHYVGVDAGAVAPRLNWGSGQSASTGAAYYRLVEFGINLDRDGDGVPDAVDNCPSLPNALNTDVGGAGDGSAADGIGDACQCGDLDGNGRAGSTDLARFRAALVDPDGAGLDPDEQTRCGSLGDPFRCDLAELVALARAQADLGPGIGQSCIAAQSFEPSCGDGVCTAGVESCRSCTIDCGRCAIGEACVDPGDCASGVCTNGLCAAVTPTPGTPRCGDGICEGKETCSRVGLYGCYDDCGPCSSASHEYCNEDSDCDGPQQCVLQGRCSDSGIFCAVDDSLDDCPGDEYCDVTAFGVIVFGGLCSDFETQCRTGPFGIAQQDTCDSGDVCRRRSICNPPQTGACGAPPVYADRCPDGQECAINDDCDSGVCYQMYVPIAGDFVSMCTPPLPDGFPCTESNDCQGLCNFGFCMSNPLPDGAPCTIAAACESGICNGFCAPAPLPNGTPCFSSSVCASGLCVNGVCSADDCGDGTCNTPFESCASPDPGAPFGVRCQADCGKCEDGHQCVDDTDCESGACDPFVRGCLACRFTNDGSCANGELCDDDVDCATGNCVGEELELYGACAPVPPACSGSNRPNGCGCTASNQCSSNRCVGYGGSSWCIQTGCTAPGNSCDSSGDCCDFPGYNLGCYDQNPLPILTSYRCALGPA